MGGKHAYISRDSTGNIWLLTTNKTTTTPTRYDLTAFKSRTPGDISSFVATGNMIGDVNQATIKGSIVGVGRGTDVLAVFCYQGNVAARVYTSSSWGAMTTIFAIGAGNAQNTENAPACVVVDGKGVAHLVYGDGHEQTLISKPFIWYAYYNGAWSTPYRLDSVGNNRGNMYPTLSLDLATGNLFAFWIEQDASAAGIKIVAKKNTTGTWTSYSLTSDTTYVKQFLTSIYSAPSENSICWQWTQNTTAPIDIQFDKIPEFKDLAVPIIVMMCIFIVSNRRGRTRKESNS
jgi:hypothetical protein